MKIELKGVEIQIGDKAVKLTIAEALELRKQLHELFGEKTEQRLPSTPIYIERVWWDYWRYPVCRDCLIYTTESSATNSLPEGHVRVYGCTAIAGGDTHHNT